MPALTSRGNPKIRLVRALRQRKTRDETGLFVVEGIHHVGQAVAAGAGVEFICYAPDLLTSPFGLALIEGQLAHGLPCYAVTAESFASLAAKDNPTGLLAVVRRPHLVLEHLTPATFPWGVALVAPQDPGNVGTILRTIDAVGASGLLLLDSSVDPYHPSTVRASLGALFWFPVVQGAFADFALWTRQHGYHVYGTSARGRVDYRTVAGFERPMILLMGSEREGLSPKQAAACEQVIRLPMLGRASSLNLAVAAGVMLYAMLEQVAAADQKAERRLSAPRRD